LWKDGKSFNYELNNIPRTQDLPPLMEETSGFYIYKNDVISKLNRRIGEKPFIVEVGALYNEPRKFNTKRSENWV